ncbi:MAG: hypothetical protein WBM41_05560, partial [Arenicellales bacterium]
ICDGRSGVDRLLEIPMPLFPVCNPQLAIDLKKNPDRLHQTTLLSENRDQDLWLEWFERDHLDNPRQVIEDANVRVQAAIDGQGLILADAMMKSELDAGLLRAPFNKQLSGYGYVLLRAAKGRYNKEALAMADWLMSN